jgi:hypothetical protein
MPFPHISDCALHNAPALPVTPCDCGVAEKLQIAPRRCHLELMTPAELAIRNAIHEVEKLGADQFLTDIVFALSDAALNLSDYIDTP